MLEAMRRSAQPRVRSQGEVLFEAPALRAQLVNLSLGGLCARGELPTRLADSAARRPEALRVTLGLLDGRPPIAANAKFAWVHNSDSAEAQHTFGLCFVDVNDDDRARLDEAIAARQTDDPEPSMTSQPQGELRLRLPSGPVLRAEADSIDGNGVLVGAELPWLRIGSRLEVEVDGVWRAAHATWVGLDTAPSGAARLRMRLEFEPELGNRHDSTLPYFFDSVAAASQVRAELDAIPEGEEESWARSRMRQLDLSAALEPRDPDAGWRGHFLVRLGARRRVRLALVRMLVVLLALGGLFAIARLLSHRGAPVRDVPVDVRPVASLPGERPLVESKRGADLNELESPQPLRASATPTQRAAHPASHKPPTKKPRKRRR
jgi:hypothetical protein